MSNLYGLIRKSGNLLVIHSFFLFFTVSISHSSSVPESFADLAEKLSPSVVNISTTTVIEQKSREMPSFPPGSPFEDFFNNLKSLVEKNVYLNHLVQDLLLIKVDILLQITT